VTKSIVLSSLETHSLVQSIRTDGIQERVLLVSKRRKKPDDNFTEKPWRPKGIAMLDEKAYRSIDDELDTSRDKYGIYRTIKNTQDVNEKVYVIGVHPGQVELQFLRNIPPTPTMIHFQ